MQAETSKKRKTNPAFDGGLVMSFVLSFSGFRKLALDEEEIPRDVAFRRSMRHWETARELGDPPIAFWEENYQPPADAMILLADKHLFNLNESAKTMAEGMEKAGVGEVCFTEAGKSIKIGDKSVEHFGYVDGISQPAFWDDKGRLKHHNLDIALAKEPGTKNSYGSYLVFRKLEQDVVRFQANIEELRNRLNISKELAEAQVMGRFKDGTPLVVHEGAMNMPGNNFDYSQDPFGIKCPFHAHVRKAYPREDEKRRLVRRGMPYDEPGKGAGLFFISYQRSIVDQFEFIQKNWFNNADFPQGMTGADPIASHPKHDETKPQLWNKGWNQASQPRVLFNFSDVVRFKGGEYFYAPSVSFLTNLPTKKITYTTMPSVVSENSSRNSSGVGNPFRRGNIY